MSTSGTARGQTLESFSPFQAWVAVNGLVRDHRGRVLLIRRNDTRTWATPGGGVESGETFEEALRREILEETGVLVRPDRLLDVELRLVRPTPGAWVTYSCRPVSGSLRPSPESPDLCYFDPDHLPAAMLAVHRERLSRWLSHNGGSAQLFVTQPTWRERLHRAWLRRAVYPLIDLRRRLAGDPFVAAQPWTMSADPALRHHPIGDITIDHSERRVHLTALQ